nr:MAG TPA: hypothetical protein [Caudoviricetes sp.]
MGVTCIKTVKKPSYLQQSIPDAEKRAAKTQGVGDSGSIKRMQEELEGLRNEIAKKNRDQLDMMYNLDFENFSEDTQALFKKWSNGTTEAMAYFKAYADANEAKWEAYAEWKNDTTDSIASITGRVSANESSISSLASWKSNTADAAISSIAGIRQTANANKASIDQITAWKTETADGAIESISSIQQQANANGARIGLLVNSGGTGLNSSAAGIIVEAINNAASSIKISADHIQISGETEFITAADLSDSGSTLVSGNRIRLVTEQGNKNGTSRLSFVMKTPTEQVFAYMDGGDLGSGAENDARYRVRLMTRSITVGGEEYYPAIYLYSAGGISLDANTSVYVYSATYTTVNAHYNTRVTANMPYSTAISAASASKYDYVFCTDGIYYNGKNICPISGNSSVTQEVQS